MRPHRRGSELLLVSALLVGACADAAPRPRPDLLLVTVDTLRADHCSAYGYARETTPNLDRIAAAGVRFEVAYAPMGTTSPSHATLFTARSPIALGMVRNGLPLDAEERTLAELLREQGYRTAAFVSSFPVSRRFGFDQGFDHFDDRFDAASSKVVKERWVGADVTQGFDRPADVTVDAALEWLGAAPLDRPLLLWLHLFDPHAPCDPPEELRRRFSSGRTGKHRKVALYDGAVAFADRELGRVAAAMRGRAPGDGTLIVLTADHGEGLSDHGFPGHNRSTYEEELRVPLVLAWEGRLEAGSTVAGPAHLVDVLPTLAGLLGLEPPHQGRGIDLFGPGGVPAERPVFLVRPFYPGGRTKFEERGRGHGVRSGRWKYFSAPDEGREELYDLSSDPGEQRNLAASEAARAAELRALLDGWVAAELEAGAGRDLAERPEDLEALEALGYMDGVEDGRE